MALKANERLIVALDVPTVDEALELVKELRGIVSYFKVGMELWAASSGSLLDRIQELGTDDGNKVFFDLKIGYDIPTTIRRTVNVISSKHKAVRLLTLNAAGPIELMMDLTRAAVEGRAMAKAEYPKLLTVPYFSSLDESDFLRIFGGEEDGFDDFILKRSRLMLDAGADGLIASGESIALIRSHTKGATIVSPGIRPAGSGHDDHKRFCTPTEAIRMGAERLVVGRPICSQPTPRERQKAAESIVVEIERALPGGGASGAETMELGGFGSIAAASS